MAMKGHLAMQSTSLFRSHRRIGFARLRRWTSLTGCDDDDNDHNDGGRGEQDWERTGLRAEDTGAAMRALRLNSARLRACVVLRRRFPRFTKLEANVRQAQGCTSAAEKSSSGCNLSIHLDAD